MKWLLSYSFPFPALNFKFSERTFYILLNERQCVVRLEAVVFTHLTKVTWRNSHCRFYTPSTTSGLGTPLTSSHSWKIMPSHLININTYLGKNVKFHSNLDIVIGKIKFSLYATSKYFKNGEKIFLPFLTSPSTIAS